MPGSGWEASQWCLQPRNLEFLLPEPSGSRKSISAWGSAKKWLRLKHGSPYSDWQKDKAKNKPPEHRQAGMLSTPKRSRNLAKF